MLDDSYNGDRFIKSAIDKSLTRLNDIIAIKRPSLKCRDKMVLSGKSDKKFESIGLKKSYLKRQKNGENFPVNSLLYVINRRILPHRQESVMF